MTECRIKTKNYQCVNYFMFQLNCLVTEIETESSYCLQRDNLVMRDSADFCFA